MPFNDFLKRMLGLESASPTCRQLKRTSDFSWTYQSWIKKQEYLNWTLPFFKAYHFQKTGIQAGTRVQLLQEGHVTRGAIFFYDPSIGTKNFNLLFDFFKDQVVQAGYTLRSSDEHLLRHQRYTETIEKHLLVPPASDIPGSDLCNQLYGNVMLDFVKVNDKPGYIRLAVSPYQDPFFSVPLPFDELVEKVLQPRV